MVANEELLIRAVTSWHQKRNEWFHLFRNPKDDRVSVNRGRWISCWIVKLYARANVQNLSLTPPKCYVGLAFVSAEKVRACKSEVEDSRKEYLGHADIRHNIPGHGETGEAPSPEFLKELNNRAKRVANSAIFVDDPNPKRLCWRNKCQAKRLCTQVSSALRR